MPKLFEYQNKLTYYEQASHLPVSFEAVQEQNYVWMFQSSHDFNLPLEATELLFGATYFWYELERHRLYNVKRREEKRREGKGRGGHERRCSKPRPTTQSFSPVKLTCPLYFRRPL